MNKSRLTVFIFVLVLIAFITAVLISESTVRNRTQCVTVIHSAENAAATTSKTDTAKAATETRTIPKVSDTATTVSSAPITDNITDVPETLYVNINTADSEEFVKLPGIGEVLAERIVEYRDSTGYFRNIEEIMLVNGIGEGIFSEIRENIYVDDPVYNTEIVSEPEQYSEPVDEFPEEPTEEDTETSGLTLEEAVPIDLNTADVETLMLLPYITEEYAVKIIELRELIGGFSHPYEIYYIEVLEQQQVNEIVQYVTVGP